MAVGGTSGCFPHDERAGHGEVHRKAAFGGKGAWQFRDFVQYGSSVFFSEAADIFVAAADGSRLRQIVDEMPGLLGVRPMSAFSVSPDGGRLVYSTCRYPPARLQDVAERLDRADYQYEIAFRRSTARTRSASRPMIPMTTSRCGRPMGHAA